ncbi:MAG TPA: hypothetical protein VF755_13515 [Catenuloplanes sp.]
MDTLTRTAAQLDAVAATLHDSARQLADLTVPAVVLGADTPGRPGELGQALHALLTAALDARVREATDAAGRLADNARAVRAAAADYVEADSAADRRHRES